MKKDLKLIQQINRIKKFIRFDKNVNLNKYILHRLKLDYINRNVGYDSISEKIFNCINKDAYSNPIVISMKVKKDRNHYNEQLLSM